MGYNASMVPLALLPRPRSLALSGLLLLSACGADRSRPEGAASLSQVGGEPEVVEVDLEPAVQPPRRPSVEPVEAPGEGSDFRTATSAAGRYTVRWRPVGGEVPNNRHFELDVWLYRGTEELEPLSGARLYVSGWMPDHGHGLVVSPKASEQEPGHYLVRGMLLHMGGFWQVFFDVIDANGISERAAFELELP